MALAAGLLPAAEKPSINVAAASNLSEVCPALGAQFEAESGIHAVFSFGSTAVLTQQIENGAPFDLFLAADDAHVQQLEGERLLVPGSRALYATGVLALWIPRGGDADLASARVKVIALAKPELAPYGEAAVEALKKQGLWDRVKDKIVYADNIGMAKQYGTSGNADAVFTAWSLVLKESGKVTPVDEALHKPIMQELGIVAKSAHQAEARAFSEYLIAGKGRQILTSHGYRPPAGKMGK